MTGEQELFAEGIGGNGLSMKEHFLKYLSNYPIFIISLIICVGSGILYTRYTTPKYKATTLLLLKGTKNGGSGQPGDLLESALNGKPKVNFDLDNEMQLMKAEGLMERVVVKNNLNISYYQQGKLRYTDIYLDAPFRLLPQHIADSTHYISLTIKDFTANGGTIEYGPEKNIKTIHFKWNQSFNIKNNVFALAPEKNAEKAEGKFVVSWSPVIWIVQNLLGKFNVGLLDKNTSIVQLDILTENPELGEDVLNSLSKEYNLTDMEDRNSASQSTIRFIDERLSNVSKELNGVEGNLENFRGKNQLINVETQSSQSFSNQNNVSKNLSDLGTQQGVVQMIMSYFNSPANQDKLVPSTLGLNDATLSSLINQYNDLQLKKQRETPLVSTNSMILKDLNNQIGGVRSSIIESLNNINKNLRLQQTNLSEQNGGYKQFLSSLPGKERAMQEMKRKQTITENLYLYLLQKREEAALSATSTNVSNFKQIEPAKAYGPVEPNSKNILIYTAILGLLLPLGIIYLKDFFNDKIVGRNDITRKISLPVVGDISHIEDDKSSNGILIMNRGVTGEQFRIIRTNLAFQLKNRENTVIMVTSSVSGEGKTLISLNLASVLAIPGKKVALLEFDLRNPGITKSLGIENKIGLSDFVLGKTDNLSEICGQSKDISTLDIYSSGSSSANPADLLLNDRMKLLFTRLKQQYDYIIIDSAPAGLVSDAFVLGEYSDAVIYVVRQRFTLKKQLDFINDIVSTQKLSNLGLILNDVKTGARHGYFGYGYGEYEEAKKKNLKNKILPSLPAS